jgi:hypothetical protein
MATIRRAGFGSVFEVENEKVGIGTTGDQTNTLQVLGETRASDAKIIGLSTLTTYQGFLDKDAKLGTTVIDFEKKSGSLNNTIIDGDVNVSSASTLTTSLNQLTMTDSFSIPTGNTDSRIHCQTAGSMRFNEDLGTLEFYNGNMWRTVNSYKDTGNRGICMLMGGDVPARVDFASYVNIMTQGNTRNFGDLNTAISQSGGAGNEIRAMLLGGSTPGPNSNEIQYTTLGTQGKFQDFGDLSSGRQTVAAVSTSVQATATAGATDGDSPQNILEYVNIMTLGNAIDLGDLQTQRRANGAFGSPVRGVVVAGCTPTIIGNIEFFTPQSKGNATNWGEMDRTRNLFAFSNSTRGIIAGGFDGSRLNLIEYLTIASSGTNVSDFGDLTLKKDSGGANGHSSNQVRGLITGGYDGSSIINNIDFITIATAGNAQDFGDCSQPWGYIANTTDSHGGLGGF